MERKKNESTGYYSQNERRKRSIYAH